MKNSFCRRTKLTENEFELIASRYVTGETASSTAKWLVEMQTPIARQSVEKKFLDLGNYHYRKYQRVYYEEFAATLNRHHQFEKIEKLLLAATWSEIRGTQDYSAFRRLKIPYIVDERLAYILKWRWKTFNGLTRDTFTSHVGFASFYLATAHMNRLDAWKAMLRELEKDPL